MMKPLLKNPDLQKTLDDCGFVTIPYLNAEELEAVKDFYNRIHPDGKAPHKIENIHMTTWCQDRNYKNEVGSFLRGIFKRANNSFFQNFRAMNEVFIVKDKGESTTFKVHQDWSIVDEHKYPSVNVWMPLHDVNPKSGGLWFLPGSHKIDRPIRGSGYLFPDYSPFFDQLEESAISVELKAGEAIVFYLNGIHGSPPNLTIDERRATCFSVIPKEAPLTIYFQPEKGLPLEKHHPKDDFMYQYERLRTDTMTKPPSAKAAGVFPSYVNEPVKLEEIAPMLVKKERSFLERLKGWVS